MATETEAASVQQLDVTGKQPSSFWTPETRRSITHSQRRSISSIRNNRWKLHHLWEPQTGRTSKIQSNLFNNMITAQNVPSLEAHLIFPVITKSFFKCHFSVNPRGLLAAKKGAVCAGWLTGLSSQPHSSAWLYHLLNHAKSSKPLAPAAYLPWKMHTLAHFHDCRSWFTRKKTP